MSFFEAGLFIPPAHLVVVAGLVAIALVTQIAVFAVLAIRFWRGE